MQPTDTKSFTTTNGFVIEHKPYLTGRQLEEIVLIQGQNEEDRKRLMGHATMKLAIVSVNGNAENVLDSILDMPVSDYAEVQEAIGELVTGKKNEVTTPKI